MTSYGDEQRDVAALADRAQAHDVIRRLERDNAKQLDRLFDLAERVNNLSDEVTRLRASMPAQVLREYDRRHWGGS